MGSTDLPFMSLFDTPFIPDFSNPDVSSDFLNTLEGMAPCLTIPPVDASESGLDMPQHSDAFSGTSDNDLFGLSMPQIDIPHYSDTSLGALGDFSSSSMSQTAQDDPPWGHLPLHSTDTDNNLASLQTHVQEEMEAPLDKASASPGGHLQPRQLDASPHPSPFASVPPVPPTAPPNPPIDQSIQGPEVVDLHTYAGRNPDLPVIQPLPRRANKPSATTKASAAAKKAATWDTKKALQDAVVEFLGEQKGRIEELAKAHNVDVKKVKELAGMGTYYKQS